MRFIWPASARSELRAIGRETAVRILHSLTEYSRSGKGDLKALGGAWQGYFRLRVGDYRLGARTARLDWHPGRMLIYDFGDNSKVGFTANDDGLESSGRQAEKVTFRF